MNCHMSGTFFGKLLPLRTSNIVSLSQMMKKSYRKALIKTFYYVRQSNAPFSRNYAKYYFYTKHLEKGSNREWWDPFQPLPNVALNL